MSAVPADWPHAPLDFSARADLPEIMDDDGLDAATYAAVVADLARVNTLTLARWPTLAWLKRQAPSRVGFTLLDVGYGHGDMLRAIARWARGAGLRAELIGIDLNPRSAPVAAAASTRDPGISFRTGRAEALEVQPDFIISSLVAHHMSDAELIAFIQWMERTARVGWMINDLRRHWAAWAGFRLLAFVCRWHPIVAHDGALSVRRAFTREDWQRLLAQAGVQAELRPHFPFRWTVESCPK
ncbi:methyltransferase domain-containing protein [Sandarakinorhabdus sp.]|uniref:methyltransferase domain-containing protein n=1 Tax=Sandarakinorhabdus sp. TaxID=1916663 RepID=UPI00286DC8BC|nr:methyltransferase domain-containing protein [Sandarakinorhabdus sp.]